MNCSEVMELMQRQLDHDLNESEQSLLTEHLNCCAACTEMFERLKMLNDGLEQLPKVMPKISLVDSILPQLDEIDRLNAIQDQANASKHLNWRTTSAVVAAGLVFGLFIVNYDGPGVQESADFIELSAKNEQTAASISQADKSNTAEQFSAVKPENKQDAAATPQAAAATDADSAPEADSYSTMDTSAADSADSKVNNEDITMDTRAVEEPADNENQTNGSNGTFNSTSKPAVKTEPTQAPASKNDNIQPQEMDSADSNVSSTSVDTGNGEKSGSMRSTFATGTPLLTISPDQKYEAAWEDGYLTVSKKDGESSSLLQSITWKTEPGELRWSEDSKQLTIVSTNTAGHIVEVIYEVSDKGLKQIKVSMNMLSIPNPPARSMTNDVGNSTDHEVPSDAGEADSSESSQP